MNAIYPTELTRTKDRSLTICWSDGMTQELSYQQLREACQCATCVTENSKSEPVGALPVLTAAQARPLEIVSMQPVGNYAYSIQFSDGHSTGIFTFEMLRGIESK